MRIETQEIEIYEYQELSIESKEKVKQWYLDGKEASFFHECLTDTLDFLFPNSDLKVTFSLGYRQGDGLNIYGKLNLFEMLEKMGLEEEEKTYLKFYLENGVSDLNFTSNSRYSYSCKFLEKKEIENYIEEQVEFLEYVEVEEIDQNLLLKFYNSTFSYFEKLESEMEKDGYDYFYEISEEDLIELCESNGYEFTKEGKLF